MRPRAFQRVQAVQAPVSSKPLLGPAIAMPNVNKYSFLLPARWGLSTARTEASVTLNGDNYEVRLPPTHRLFHAYSTTPTFFPIF